MTQQQLKGARYHLRSLWDDDPSCGGLWHWALSLLPVRAVDEVALSFAAGLGRLGALRCPCKEARAFALGRCKGSYTPGCNSRKRYSKGPQSAANAKDRQRSPVAVGLQVQGDCRLPGLGVGSFGNLIIPSALCPGLPRTLSTPSKKKPAAPSLSTPQAVVGCAVACEDAAAVACAFFSFRAWSIWGLQPYGLSSSFFFVARPNPEQENSEARRVGGLQAPGACEYPAFKGRISALTYCTRYMGNPK